MTGNVWWIIREGPGMDDIKIGIIACETFKRDLDYILGDDQDVVFKEYLEFGLHEWPEDLKKAVIDKVNSL